ncbi:hypothetical protein NW768_007574 [Fusarium equiseti]|uniref:Uncharacterized protein n=1 Tax=Fusarium equiseti TaxID=61235 RepID=A0ABQ8R7W8_FUSEQ|nr:hypothetical protein NW768_007574 [Fusarium equiseti]
MSAVSPLEDADSSQVHLLKGHIVPYLSTTPFVGGDITDEQEYIASNNRSNAGGRSTEHLDNKHELDDLSRTPSVTGIIIRKASTYNRKPKAKDLTELKGRESVLWVWRLEMFLLCVAAGLFAAICLVLDKYNVEELPDWDLLGLTLNTVIFILGTFFRAIVAVVTFEILAQRKWTWLSQDTFRPLRDIELFDSAFRGVFGCLRLLPLVTTREPVALGAATIAILSLAIGSFTQQSIQTYQCLREIET